jgi:2'-5' RNA ligase
VIRLFAALRPPTPVRAALLAAQGGVARARWQSDAQLHLTLRFIGEVDIRAADDIADALGRVTAGGFSLAAKGAGHFEKKGRPTALWAAIAPAPPLISLQAKIERACRSAGLAAEPRRFVPHVTLARLGPDAAGAGEWLAANAALSTPEWLVDRFWLYESRLGQTGSSYTPLAEWALGPPSAGPA